MENNLSGKIIPNVSLNGEKSIKEAFNVAQKELTVYPRFSTFNFDNRCTYWTAVLVLFTGHDEDGGPLLPGFSYDTGVTVGGVNVTAHSAQTTTLQPQVKVQATRVKCSANCKRDDGLEQQLNFPDQVAPAGQFWTQAGFAIQDGTSKSASEAILELTDSSGHKRFVSMKK